MPVKNQKHLQYWILRILRWDPKSIAYGVLLAVITAISGIALLMLSGWFITATAVSGASLALGFAIKLDIYMPGSGIRFFALSRTVGRYVERLYNHNIVLTLISTIRQQMFAGLARLPNRQIKDTQNSDWLSKLTADLDSLDNILLSLLLPPTVALLVTSLVGLFLAFFWPLFAVIFTLLLLVICCGSAILTIKATQQDSYQRAELLNLARGQAIEHLQGQLVLQSMGANNLHQEQLLSTIEQTGVVQHRLNRRLQNCQLAHSVLLALGLVAASLFTFFGFQQAYFSGPMTILIILACVGVVELLQTLPAQFGLWGKTEFAAQRLRPMAEQSSHQGMFKQAKSASPSSPKSQGFTSLHITLANHPYIPASIDKTLSITLGNTDKLLILGKSGRGKSTLSDLLCGQADTQHFKQTQCDVLLNGQALVEDNLAEWQQHLGYLTQQNSILADTLYANLSLGMHDLQDKQIFAALDMVDLGDWARALPEQLNSWLGDTGNKLSGGQARRLCLARLLLKSPQLIVLDEPFNGIDHKMAAKIWAKITPWLQDRCVILLMHEAPTFWHYRSTSDSASVYTVRL